MEACPKTEKVSFVSTIPAVSSKWAVTQQVIIYFFFKETLYSTDTWDPSAIKNMGPKCHKQPKKHKHHEQDVTSFINSGDRPLVHRVSSSLAILVYNADISLVAV